MPTYFQIPLNLSFTDHPAIRRHIIWAADSVTYEKYTVIYPNNLLFSLSMKPVSSSQCSETKKMDHTLNAFTSVSIFTLNFYNIYLDLSANPRLSLCLYLKFQNQLFISKPLCYYSYKIRITSIRLCFKNMIFFNMLNVRRNRATNCSPSQCALFTNLN
jgi:hypothetical protein